MKVSVLIPAHNYDQFVGGAVESVLAQDYGGELECIVVDDGSTDRTWEVVSSFEARGVTVLRQQNRGQAAALNTAFHSCSGDIVCFLDADDVWLPEKVRVVTEAMKSNPNIGLVHHAVEMVGPHADPLPNFTDGGTKAQGDVSRLMWAKVLRWMFSPFSTLCIRRPIADVVFPLITSMVGNADDLIASSASLLAPVAYLPQRLTVYRVHGGNMWAAREASRQQGSVVRGEVRALVPDLSPAPRDVNRLPERLRYCRLLEEKTRQANLVLKRAKLPGRLSPWVDWTYLKTEGRSDPWSGLRRALTAVWDLKGIPWRERLTIAWRFSRRMVREYGLGRGLGSRLGG